MIDYGLPKSSGSVPASSSSSGTGYPRAISLTYTPDGGTMTTAEIDLAALDPAEPDQLEGAGDFGTFAVSMTSGDPVLVQPIPGITVNAFTFLY